MAGQSVETQIVKALKKRNGNTVGGPIGALPKLLKLECGRKPFITALENLVAKNRVTRRESEGKRVELMLCD